MFDTQLTAAPLSSLWRAMAPRAAAIIALPGPAELIAAADACGEARGRAAAQDELTPLRAALAAATAALHAAATIDAETIQPLFANLITRIASAVIDGELRTSPAAIARLVAAALAAIELDGDPVLHLSESDASLIDSDLRVEIDPALAHGEIRVETPRHVVAASLSQRLADIVADTA